MKRAVCLGLGVWLMGGSAVAAGFRVGFKVSYFSSENGTFRDIYGGAAKVGLDGGLNITKRWSLWTGLDYLNKSGKLTVTKEETRTRIIPLTVGLRYEIPAAPRLRFHIGAGAQEVFFREETVFGTAQENALGFIASAGGSYRLVDGVGIGIFAAWSTCKMTHEDIGFKVGGLDVGGGLEIRF